MPEEVLQLEAQEQILEPAFRWKNTLTSLCEYRVHYMRSTYLLHNWNTAKFAKYTTSTIGRCTCNKVIHSPNGIAKNFYNDRYLFISYSEEDGDTNIIEVWDVGKEPVLYKTFSITNCPYVLYVIGSKLVIVECKKVCVYEITLPKRSFPLLYTFIPTETEAGDMQNYEETECDGYGEHLDLECYNIAQYLVFNKSGFEGGVIHVWDIMNAKKVGAFALPVEGVSVNVESHEEDEWLLRQVMRHYNDPHYFLFNIKDKTFTETGFKDITLPNKKILYKSHILTFTTAVRQKSDKYDTICVVHDLKTSAVRKRTFKTSRMFQVSSPFITNGHYIIHCTDHFQKINALTLETVNRIQYKGEITFTTHQFNVFGSIFVGAVDKAFNLSVWNVTNKNYLVAHPNNPTVFRCALHLNDSMTKLVLVDNNGTTVFHFW